MINHTPNGYAIALDSTGAQGSFLNFEQMPSLISLGNGPCELPRYWTVATPTAQITDSLQKLWVKHKSLVEDEYLKEQAASDASTLDNTPEPDEVELLAQEISDHAQLHRASGASNVCVIGASDSIQDKRSRLLELLRQDPTVNLRATVTRDVAACNFHFWDDSQEKTVLVADLQDEQSVYSVVQWDGETSAILGKVTDGTQSVDDWLNLLANQLSNNAAAAAENNAPDNEMALELFCRLQTERLLDQLASDQTAQLKERVWTGQRLSDFALSRDLASQTAQPLFKAAMTKIKQLLKDTTLDVDGIVLIGNRFICGLLEERLRSDGLQVWSHRSDSSPCLGGALLAEKIGAERGAKPFGIVSLDTKGKQNVTWLFGNGKPEHGKEVRYVTTVRDDQTRLIVELTTGSGPHAIRQYLSIEGLIPSPAGAWVRVQFEFDGHRLTGISAHDSGEQSLQCVLQT